MAAAFLSALAVSGLLLADGQSSQMGHSSNSGVITLRACNKVQNTVLVATSYIPVGGSNWLNNGWTRIEPGNCSDVLRTTNKTFYARAEVLNDSSSYWGSDIQQCVEYPGPYNFYTKSEDTTCPEGEPQEFTTFHSDGSPTYVWNLNPE